MRRKPPLIVWILTGIFSAWILARLFGLITFYSVPTPSMEPTVKTGDWIFATNLVKATNNKIVIFNWQENGKKTHYIKRLAAMPGQTLEIKNGYAYVNGKLNDDTMSLYFQYMMPNEVYSKHNNIFRDRDASPIGNDWTMLYLSPKDLQSFRPDELVKRVVVPDDSNLSKDYFYSKRGGSIDQLGSVVIPPDSCFLLGDNRHNSLDSRFYGFVALKEITGVVINK